MEGVKAIRKKRVSNSWGYNRSKGELERAELADKIEWVSSSSYVCSSIDYYIAISRYSLVSLHSGL